MGAPLERGDARGQEAAIERVAVGVHPALRSLAKRLLKPPSWLVKALLWRPLLLVLRASNRRAGLIVMYHSVGDRDGDPQRELVPPISRERFASQLSYLRRYYRFVELSDLQSAVIGRRAGEPFPVAVTFDDDLGNHVTHALPELRSADAPATFFLCGSFLEGPPRDYWWQRLQRAVDSGANVAPLLGAGTIHQQGQKIEALTPDLHDAVADELERLAAPVPKSELLHAHDARQLPHIGFHTIHHHRLTGLNDEQLTRALTEGRAELAEVAGSPVDTIAYPHGVFDSRVVAAARRCEFKIGVTCERQAVTPGSDPLAFGRYEPPTRCPKDEFAFDLVFTLLKTAV